MAFPGVSNLPFYVRIQSLGLEPRHTIHVYGPPSSLNMTMEPLGLAQDTLCDVCVLCVCASVCVLSYLPLQVVYISGQICSFLQNWAC